MREENITIIRALNKYGRVPEQWELLNMIEELEKKKIDKAIQYIKTYDIWILRVNDNLSVETIRKDKLLEILGGNNEE